MSSMDQIQKIVLLVSFALAIALTALILAGTVPFVFGGPGVLCLVATGFMAQNHLKNYS